MKLSGPLSICIVDDDEMFLKTLKHYLQEKLSVALTFNLFKTGEEFLKAVNNQQFDIVILDYVLNGTYPHAMDGMAVLKKFRQNNPDATIIVLSSQCKIEIALESIREGASDYVVKNENVFMKTKNILRDATSRIEQMRNTKRSKMKAIVYGLVVILGLSLGMALKTIFFN